MIYLMIFAFCEISSGCKVLINSSYKSEKDCRESMIKESEFLKKAGSKGSLSCVNIKEFE